MENSKQLARRLKDVLLDGKWIANANFNEQISGLNWKQATQQIGTLNSIALLTFHINYYIKGVLHVLEGGDLEIKDKYSFDLPPINSAEAWDALRKDFILHAELFISHLQEINEDKLEEKFVLEEYGTYRRNIEGIIEHCYYHLGQIVLLNKMLKEIDK